MKILINTPFITSPAGVSNHFLGLKDYFSNNVIYNQFYTSYYIRRRIRAKWVQKLLFPFAVLFNYLNFFYLIVKYKKPTILLNPSFGKTGMQRDAYFLKIGKLMNCKVAIFFHGWDKKYLSQVLKKREPFSDVWFKADAFFVLASEFKNYLQQLNIKAPIHLTTTKVDNKLVENSPLKLMKEIKTILFLARVEKAKGIFTAIDTFEILKNNYPDLKMTVVGNGNALDSAKKYVSNKNLDKINFTGPLWGEDLKKEFLKADLYILPTHGEGMPTSVLEAMAFGLPIITRPVGGLIDFFQNEKMGYMIESLDAKDYAGKIEHLINNTEKVNNISSFNRDYAFKHFLASDVAKELESVLMKI